MAQAGTLSHVVLDPNGLKITHIVVTDKEDSDARTGLFRSSMWRRRGGQPWFVSHVRSRRFRGCRPSRERSYVSYQYDDYTSRRLWYR